MLGIKSDDKKKMKNFKSLKVLKSVDVFLFSVFKDIWKRTNNFKVISILMIYKNIEVKYYIHKKNDKKPL